MRHILYGLFIQKTEADEAVKDIQSADIPAGCCELVVHPDRLNRDDLKHSESDAKNGLWRGVIAGCVGGGMLGFLMAGPLGLLHLNEMMAAGGGLVLGGVMGGLGGTLFGSGLTDDTLSSLAKQLRPGRVLITADVEGDQVRDQVTQIFQRHGARVAS